MHAGPAYSWGASAEERSLPYPCDHVLPDAEQAYFRAVDVAAPAEVLFRWLCQLRVAPYSYDWLDNRGRRSPRSLTPGLEELSAGQRMMSIFSLVEFERDRHLTMLTPGAGRLLGKVAVTYLIAEAQPGRCRLLVKLLVVHPSGASLHLLSRALLPWGDLIMMRRQLLNLKELAEREWQAGAPVAQAEA